VRRGVPPRGRLNGTALRYADLYYRVLGGSRINRLAPRYVDFVYVAYTIGVTFAESDADLTSTRLRPAVLPYALSSVMFGAVILASR